MVTRVKNVLGKNSIIKVLLSLVIVLAMISQFALPAMADMVVEQPATGFMPTTISTTGVTSSSYTTLYSYTVPTNTTATSVNIECACANYQYYLKVVANGTTVIGPVVVNESTSFPTCETSENFSAGAGTTILIEAEAYSSGQTDYPEIYAAGGVPSYFNYTYSGTTYCIAPTYLMLEYDAANETTATNAYNEATTAATDAAAAQSEATTAATNASNAYTAANTASTNTTSDPTADAAITNSTTGVAATNATVGTINTNTAATNTTVGTINTDTATVSGHTAAYWAQANNTTLGTVNTNTTSDPAADTAITNSTNGMAATNTTVGTINTDTAQYNGETAAYWANQAATAATSNIIPVISSVVGQNGATCTTGTTFTANVAVSPSSSITYTVTGVPGYSASGNSITFTGLSSGAYTAIITATYTPTGKTCTYPFTFFKI
jgi:hypothetical protein